MLASVIECVCIACAATAAFLFSEHLPGSLQLGYVINLCATLLLGQGLVRDLFILARQKRAKAGDIEQKKETAICLESSLGMVMLMVGIMLMLAGVGPRVPLGAVPWGGIVLSIMSFGWATRNVVIKLGPLRLAIEKDHANILFAWKRGA